MLASYAPTLSSSSLVYQEDRARRSCACLLQVLQDSLCGSSKVLLVANLAPEAASAAETLSSLAFAARAAKVPPLLNAGGPGSSCSHTGCRQEQGGYANTCMLQQLMRVLFAFQPGVDCCGEP